MIPSLAGKLLRMDCYAKTSLLLLILASILFTLSLITYSWFELPGIAWYGPLWAKFCDNLGECHYIPAFFTKEPVFYHVLQLMCMFSVAAINGAIYLLLVEKADLKISRWFRKTKGQSIAMICFMSAFAVSGSLYLFYHIIDDFPREAGIYPEMHWAAMLASLSCGLQFMAGLFMLNS
ncbi:uncharacterized protein LOC127873120 [Dreissena polymorpha]|uniref:Uncharacterized protein n=1 Tax=Dreissena polymorpha TaxID=45954 RepID=A0A9D4QWZ9_DREPO|nr:uncharacterized protein LOC127873120 [Dreissena polymorpha]KAH3845771.1 hypothetical protein DPMN_088059 [Dreissena polymorpha]KAH3845792.1 hypothetical protein DPMN_088081 [Dreissena polymorpha]